jgi:hypothetical protein
MMFYSRIRTAQSGIDCARAKLYQPDRQSLEVRGFLFVFGLVLHISSSDAHSLHVLHRECGGARKEIEVYGMHQVQGQGKH